MANARREAAELAKVAAADGVEEIAAHDWAYYSEQVRQSSYQVDAAALRPYFELERVLRDGVFFAANLAYGVSFTERPDLVGYHPDVRVFEVFDADGTALGLFLGDFHARVSKRGGAWMDELVTQSGLLGQRPVVYNNLNIAKPAARRASPAVLGRGAHAVPRVRPRAARAVLGRALPVLRGHRRAAGLRGVPVPGERDVDGVAGGPGQLRAPPRHGRAAPAELVGRIEAAESFGQGFRTVEYLAAALLDWAWHTLPEGQEVADAEEFEAAALAKAGLAVAAVPPRYRTTYFGHIFAGGYSAGYYAYIWSEVLDADTVEWFKDGGRSVRESGEVFRRELLARGDSRDALDSFRAVVGRDPETAPLLARRGLL